MGVGMAKGAMILCTTVSISSLWGSAIRRSAFSDLGGPCFKGAGGISRRGIEVSFLYELPTTIPFPAGFPLTVEPAGWEMLAMLPAGPWGADVPCPPGKLAAALEPAGTWGGGDPVSVPRPATSASENNRIPRRMRN